MLYFDILNQISENYPIIIKPNIGQPLIINLGEYFDRNIEIIKDITIEIILLGNSKLLIRNIIEILSKNIFLQPILRDSGPFEQRRGKKYQLELINISKINFIDIKKLDHNNEELVELADIYNNLQNYKKILKNRNMLFKCLLKLKNVSEINNILKEINRTFLLFDIIQEFPKENKARIVFHSLALYNKSWDDFKFIHATDSHIARRNDLIFQFLKEKTLKNLKEKEINNINKNLLKRVFEFNRGFQDDTFQQPRHGMYNFNNNLRNFISFANEKVKKNELDFIFITGDLIDYVNLANYDKIYKNNFQVFLDILLGIDRDSDIKQEDISNEKEILAPIFTILGNHDYRLGHYSIFTSNMFKIFGLEKNDIKGYKDKKIFYGIKALYSAVKYLYDYFLFINPNRNFKVNIGSKYTFIFLDSGIDSIANLIGLIREAPSTRGLKKMQIKILRNYINQSNDKHIVLLMHAPPLSPKLSKRKKKKLAKKFKLERDIEWRDFYEENLEKYIGSSRLESLLNLKDQTLMYRWGTLMKILSGSDKKINKKIDLVLCGHSHTLKEFRLQEAKKSEKKRVNMGFYFVPIYIHIPCRVFTNRYRDIIKYITKESDLNNWFNANKPFILHTQGLGPLSYKMKVKAPGFRYITVKNNQIIDFSVYSLHLK